ncbi:uncharacterized protein LOC127925321 [Oncorhynchus keta]|uniref:uncharacterized protein LOC127925321 n=1 Tax=Oncorhynchus keta TaxID=8018 RepID=UPI00227C570E|nr:uncharacterized protein LOC127925321 [Oncorhynchus keta]
MYLGGHTGSVAKPGRRPAPTSCAYRRARETGQAPCYAVERTVSPVRVHSPVRYIPAPRIDRARVGVEPGAMKPALRIWSPVRLLGPAYMAPALRMVSPVCQHSPPGAFNQVRLGMLGAQELQCACTVRSIQCHLHAPALRWQPPAPGCLSGFCLQGLPPVQRCQSLPPLQRCQSLPSVQRQSPICPELLESRVCPELLESRVCPELLESRVCPELLESRVCPELLESRVCPELLESRVCPELLESRVCPELLESRVCPELLESRVCLFNLFKFSQKWFDSMDSSIPSSWFLMFCSSVLRVCLYCFSVSPY